MRFLCIYISMGAPYSQRNPEKTPLYRLIDDHYAEFKSTYNEKYGDIYGFYRPEIDKEIEKYQECGIYRFGFAKLKCSNTECGEEYFLPFSCHSRGLCPSCIQKHSLELEMLLKDEILRSVPMRHLVFTIPVLLRKNFLWHREHLNELSRMAWQCIKTFMGETLKVDGIPGSVQCIETSGQFLDIQTHLHVLVTDGIFTEDGIFHKMPPYSEGARIYFKSLWEKAVAKFCVKKGFINEGLMKKMLFWTNTGFSIYTDTRVDYKHDDSESSKAMGHLIRYISKPPIAMSRLTYKGGKVLYKGDFHKGKKRNFETYDPLDFLAALTSHIPKYRQKYTNFYGVFSNRTRGYAKENGSAVDNKYPVECPDITKEQRLFRKSWAVLLKRIWETDPLKCPRCGSEMKITAIITDGATVKKILKSINMWIEIESQHDPPMADAVIDSNIESIPYEDGWGEPIYT
jgi:Putative transposase/Transposase zinc-binding domain